MSGSTARARRQKARKGLSFFPNPWRQLSKRDKKRVVNELAPKRPGARGWMGRGGGSVAMVDPAPMWRATTVQACGLFPFAIGAGAPMIGVPLGRHLFNGATLCCDPISWFQRAKLISNPSVFVLGKPGLGKSTIVRRMATGLSGYGVLPLVLGDLKPDYVDMIRALGGQVISLGPGRGYLNVLDPGEAREAADRLHFAADEARASFDAGELDGREADERVAKYERLAREVLADAHSRRKNMVSALLTIQRQIPPTDREETIIDRAIKWLDSHFDGIPVLGDLLQVIQDGPREVRAVAVDRGNDDRYRAITEDLEASLISLSGGGRLGEIFAQPTTEPMRWDSPVVYDVSGIDDAEMDLQAAALLACWSVGFGTVNVANALAAAGLEPQRHYFVILDELWRALRAGRGIVDRVDALTRLNRQRGVGMAMISHTMSDLLALPTEEDRMKARGFVERSGFVVLGGLPRAEMPKLNSAIPLSNAEEELLIGWQDPPAWDPVRGEEAEPPGRGKFLVKVGGRPGIPITVALTPAERDMNDTNRLWHTQSRVGKRRALRADREAA